MEYKFLNEEILESITKVCRQEKIFGGHFQGIGACGEITLATFIPAENDFLFENFSGMFEIITFVDEKINLHAHAMFSFHDSQKILKCIGGHLRRAVVNYTAEIIIRPANSVISHRFDIIPEIGVWKFNDEKI